jgi:hypothetical protein
MQGFTVFDARTGDNCMWVQSISVAELVITKLFLKEPCVVEFTFKRTVNGPEIWALGTQIFGTRPYVKAQVLKQQGWHPSGRPPLDGWYNFNQKLSVTPPGRLPPVVKLPQTFFMVFLSVDHMPTQSFPTTLYTNLALSRHATTGQMEDWRELALADPALRPYIDKAETAVIGTFDAQGIFTASRRKFLYK